MRRWPDDRLPIWIVCTALSASVVADGSAQDLPRDRQNQTATPLQQRRTDHFTVSFEGPAQTSLSGGVLEALETAYWKIGGALSVRPTAPIPVVLYTAEQFHDITRSPAWAAGAFDGVIRIPMRGALENPHELERILTHEYVHALIQQLSPRPVPMWLNEGLASALEADDLKWAHEWVRRAGKPAPLAALQGPFVGLTAPHAGLAYASSALAAQRLLDEAGGAAIAALLRDVGQGREFSEAFARRTQRSLAAFQSELNGAN
jgi:hypothetical protein